MSEKNKSSITIQLLGYPHGYGNTHFMSFHVPNAPWIEYLPTFTHIYFKNHPNAGEYSIHGAYGCSFIVYWLHMFQAPCCFVIFEKHAGRSRWLGRKGWGYPGYCNMYVYNHIYMYIILYIICYIYIVYTMRYIYIYICIQIYSRVI